MSEITIDLISAQQQIRQVVLDCDTANTNTTPILNAILGMKNL